MTRMIVGGLDSRMVDYLFSTRYLLITYYLLYYLFGPVQCRTGCFNSDAKWASAK